MSTVINMALFDLEGVLVDTIDAQAAAYTAACEKHGVRFDREKYRELAYGLPWPAPTKAMEPGDYEAVHKTKISMTAHFLHSVGIQANWHHFEIMRTFYRLGCHVRVVTAASMVTVQSLGPIVHSLCNFGVTILPVHKTRHDWAVRAGGKGTILFEDCKENLLTSGADAVVLCSKPTYKT